MNPVTMADLAAQHRKMQETIEEALLAVARSGEYINGPAVRDFALRLAEYTGAKHVIPCANGTDALQIALMALGLRDGDEVIVPDFTFAATMEVVALLRLKPVAVDVDPDTFNIDAAKIREAITEKTKAIIPVHLFGQCADMSAIMAAAEENGLHVVEDNAQSLGAVYTFPSGVKRQAGTVGAAGALSFFPTKNLGCYGDGGALLTGDDSLARTMRMIASHGQSAKYAHEITGCNSRLDTLQATILNAKLPHLDTAIRMRQRTAQKYDAALSQRADLYETPQRHEPSTHVYHQYTVKIKDGRRDALQQYLHAHGVAATVYYPRPLHRQAAFQGITRIGSNLNVTEHLCRSALSLPVHPELDNSQIDYMIDLLLKYE